ncbi:MAG TPA: periplasmic heavy metal sensor [Thermoanaerobaculaceae bacterium]|nr:periplasmic heavy metal sensor [Thermoanaerobaculaceae bacterium]HPS77917.1 periplasmic heavy metal sensor [Thermoanaerobaculaceae bacterium]
MSRQTTGWGVVGALLLLATGAWAQGMGGVPPGSWWERPKVAQELGLTSEQKQRLEEVTLGSARVMIDLKASLDKAELDLKAAGDAEPLDAKRAREAFAAVQQARLRLESERFELLIKVRQVLQPEQWQRLRAMTRERLRGRIEERGPGGLPMGKRPIRRFN